MKKVEPQKVNGQDSFSPFALKKCAEAQHKALGMLLKILFNEGSVPQLCFMVMLYKATLQRTP